MVTESESRNYVTVISRQVSNNSLGMTKTQGGTFSSIYTHLNVPNNGGDFTEYIPLVPGGHRKSCLFFINVLPKMTKCYERYKEKVTRKHTRQAPRQIIGPLGLWSPPGLSTRDAQFFPQAFFVLKQPKNLPKFYFIHN